MLCYVTLRYVTLRYVTLRYVTLRYVTLRYVTLRYVTLRYVTLRYVTLPYVTLRYVTLRYVTLRYVMLCYVILGHMYLFVLRLGLIKPGQTYVCPKLWVFCMEILLRLISCFWETGCQLCLLVWAFSELLAFVPHFLAFSVGQEGHTLQPTNILMDDTTKNDSCRTRAKDCGKNPLRKPGLFLVNHKM